MPEASEQCLFEHEPLDTSTASFRLLSLLQPSSDGTIRCSLKHGSLLPAARPVYAAVSYAWGPREEVISMKRILVNGRGFPVRLNLWNLLNRLSTSLTKEQMAEDLWIDAICIDQGRFQERNHQVKLMKTIYECSQRTFVWLGEPGIELDDGETLETWPAFDLLQLTAHQDYWSRLWVVQEFLLAPSLTFIWGAGSWDWEGWASRLGKGNHRGHWDISSSMIPSTALIWRRIKAKDRVPRRRRVDYDFGYLVDRFQLTECEEIRDKIFGLLGLVDAGQTFPVDYSDDLCTIYGKVVKHFTRAVNDHFQLADAVKRCFDLTYPPPACQQRPNLIKFLRPGQSADKGFQQFVCPVEVYELNLRFEAIMTPSQLSRGAVPPPENLQEICICECSSCAVSKFARFTKTGRASCRPPDPRTPLLCRINAFESSLFFLLHKTHPWRTQDSDMAPWYTYVCSAELVDLDDREQPAQRLLFHYIPGIEHTTATHYPSAEVRTGYEVVNAAVFGYPRSLSRSRMYHTTNRWSTVWQRINTSARAGESLAHREERLWRGVDEVLDSLLRASEGWRKRANRVS